MPRTAPCALTASMLHDMYFVRGQDAGAVDRRLGLRNVLATIPGDQAFLPLEEGGCPLVKQR